MPWKQMLRRTAKAIGLILSLLVIWCVLALNGLVLVASSEVATHFVARNTTRTVPLRKFLWLSAGFPRLEGQLVAICRDGRQKPLYYIMRNENLPVHPVGGICQ